VTLKCMERMPFRQLLQNLVEQKSPLVQLSPEVVQRLPSSFMAFDGLTIPNMLEVARTFSLASSKVPITIGQAANEMDTLKFQFPLRTILTNLVQDRMKFSGIDTPESQCMQRKLFNSQGLQETAEDFMFNVGSYLAATKPDHLAATRPDQNQEIGPRWHFLITAPASLSHRAWHTAAEILSWGAEQHEDSAQYDAQTKRFVTGNVKPELRRYAHENFVHFLKIGTPQDRSWTQTVRSGGKVRGLPSKLWDQAPIAGQLHWEHHHSNLTIGLLHDIMCGKPRVSGADMENCLRNAARPTSAVDEVRLSLSVLKKSDLLFTLELLKVFNPLSLLREALHL